MLKNKLLLMNMIIAGVAIAVIGVAFLALQGNLKKGPVTHSGSNQADQAGQAEKISIPEELRIGASDHCWGDRNAPVQIVIYTDFECPFCLDFYGTIEKAKEEFDGEVAIALRHFPLRSHANAIPAAQSAECAGEQGKFWEMYESLFRANRDNKFFPEQFAADAQTIGLDIQQYEQCLSANKYLEKIANDMQEVKQFGIIGAPAFFVNGIVYPGALPLEDYTDEAGQNVMGLRSVISAALDSK